MNRVTLQPSAGGSGPVPGRAGVSSPVERAILSAVTPQDTLNVFGLDRCQDLLKQRLARTLFDTFYELTGLRLRAWWHDPTAEEQGGGFPMFCPKAHQRPAGRLPERCQTCLGKHWPCVWNGQKLATRFVSLCGALNYCACVKALGRPCVTLTVQQARPVSCPHKQAFFRAVHLTRLVIHDLQATLDAGQASLLAQPPNEGHEGAGATPAPRCRAGNHQDRVAQAGEGEPANCTLQPGHHHGQMLVQQMLSYIHENYTRPIRLADLAANVHLRPSYACSLFSTTLGVTFHHYLEQFRLARAKQLLRDPLPRITEVAYSVGYTSPNHFRNVFTARVGLSPSAWRVTPPSAR